MGQLEKGSDNVELECTHIITEACVGSLSPWWALGSLWEFLKQYQLTLQLATCDTLHFIAELCTALLCTAQNYFCLCRHDQPTCFHKFSASWNISAIYWDWMHLLIYASYSMQHFHCAVFLGTKWVQTVESEKLACQSTHNRNRAEWFQQRIHKLS